MTKQSKILIGSPTAAPYEYCLPDWAARVKELTYQNVTAVLVDNSETVDYTKAIKRLGIKAVKDPEFIKDSRLRLPHSRNILRQIALEEDYKYFLSLEQDVIPPVDVLEQLMSRKENIVTGVYYKYFNLQYHHQGKNIKTVKQLMPLLFGYIPGITTKMRFLSQQDVEAPAFFPIRFCGLGCILIHRDVLKKVKFRADASVNCHDDLWFCNDALHHGFKIYVDTKVKCKHMLSGKPSGLFADAQKGFDPELMTNP